MRTCLVILSVAALSFAASAAETKAQAAASLNDADCSAAWKEAGGVELTREKAKPFIASFDQVDVDHDGGINWEEFKVGCKKGLVHK